MRSSLLRKGVIRVNLLWLLFCLLPALSHGGGTGIYGVRELAPQLQEAQVSAVFVRPAKDIISIYAERKFKVFLTLNVFGGRGPWKEFPGSIPVTSDGGKLTGEYGGICPTHPEWRASRLQLLEQWLNEYTGVNGISGVWLDFIRYPGRWEHEDPSIPDTCYCKRCLTLFKAEKRVGLPEGVGTAEAARWIKSHAPHKWMEWKKEQVTSFARDAKGLIGRYSKERKVQLGAFLVPWRKSEHGGSLSFDLGQDATLLAPYVDVFSPMVYHRMVGESVEWVGEITDYYAEMTGVEIWPIVQAEEVDANEFSRVIQTVSDSEAGGMLVYKYADMEEDHWPLLEQLKFSENLLPDSRLDDEVVLDLTTGNDRQVLWSTELADCKPGASYLFSAEFFREDRRDSLAYPEISLWGQKSLLNTHRMTGKYQNLKAVVPCPASYSEDDRNFEFRNNYPGNSFSMRRPRIVERMVFQKNNELLPVSNFFPIGTYGANSTNLEEIKNIGLNSAVVGLSRENIEKCLSLNMRCTLSVPRDPERLILALDTFESLLQQGNFSYYVNDEPGIHSFSEGQAEDIQRIIKKRFPDAFTNMAIVRPQVIPFYEKGADYFMLDQYPVPNMPMSWLSDSMDEAALYVGRGRLQSVIQAFGGEKFGGSGWPRLPTFEEMNCLTYLSVIHGSRGVYFYTYPAITSTTQGKEDFTRLLCRLNGMRSWLLVGNAEQGVVVRMTSKNRFDPQGNPAVHCAAKEQYSTKIIICTNTIRTHTEAELDITAGSKDTWQEYFSGESYPVVDDNMRVRFDPLEVKVLIESK